ncbi:putative Glycosyltransferase [Vibrio crassostreae]|nr:putative Glycosyltransferase [Vibrio crassostreae]CAK3986103.1 putative Glycosyltransferase [Vibrio crassostreae]
MKYKENKSVDIYSDVEFYGYQHVNQFLFWELKSNGWKTNFYHRFVMNLPKFKYLSRLFFRILKVGESSENIRTENDNVRRVKNIPPTNSILDIINSLYVKKRINYVSDVAVTFVPSRSLEYLFKKYRSLIYYCVHDSQKQSYQCFNQDFEIQLCKSSNLVLCDNEKVLSRLNGDRPILDLSKIGMDEIKRLVHSGEKFFLVPPPVPTPFFKRFSSKDKVYNYVYFGSIHSDIDQDFIKTLLDKDVRINIISSEQLEFNHSNIFYSNPTSDIDELVGMINKSEAILLPYKNSEFMQSISPAKIYQSLATGLPILCSNQQLVNKYKLRNFDSLNPRIKEQESYSTKSSYQEYSSDELLGKVSYLISLSLD